MTKRKNIKQNLWKIRLYEEKEIFFLTDEQWELKSIYEKLSGFTKWGDFPEKWDIGDPDRTKTNAYAFDERDRNNFGRISGLPYETIVHLCTQQEKT